MRQDFLSFRFQFFHVCVHDSVAGEPVITRNSFRLQLMVPDQGPDLHSRFL
jgi:hypothetical protein